MKKWIAFVVLCGVFISGCSGAKYYTKKDTEFIGVLCNPKISLSKNSLNVKFIVRKKEKMIEKKIREVTSSTLDTLHSGGISGVIGAAIMSPIFVPLDLVSALSNEPEMIYEVSSKEVGVKTEPVKLTNPCVFSGEIRAISSDTGDVLIDLNKEWKFDQDEGINIKLDTLEQSCLEVKIKGLLVSSFRGKMIRSNVDKELTVCNK